MYTKLNPNKQTRAFIKYMLGKKVQDDLVSKIGYLSINKMQVKRDSNNQISKLGN